MGEDILKIAIIGSGISGLGSAWLLRNHEVHLFESAPVLGGHAKTINPRVDGLQVPMDIGFLVYNELTYPKLVKLFKALGVETAESDMSLSVQVPHDDFEWCGTGLQALIGRPKNLIKPEFYIMMKEILTFHKRATHYLQESKKRKWTLGQLLDFHHHHPVFINWYILPMAAAIWSSPEGQMLNYPAETFLNFCLNHRLLQVKDRPKWRTVKNGSINYVERIESLIPHVYKNEAVSEIEAVNEGKVKLTSTHHSELFDKVIFATHAPITRKLLKNPTIQQKELLACFETQQNQIKVHTDVSVMPKRKNLWSSWNVFSHQGHEQQVPVSLTYYSNKLQPLKTSHDLFVSLNIDRELKGLIHEQNFHHPLFDRAAIEAQKKLIDIQGQNQIYFTGAWTGYGFHEDGLKSAVNVCELIEGSDPCLR